MWKKIVAPAVLVSILWIAGSSITNYYIQGVYESHARALAENVATIRAGWAMQDALWRLESIVMEAEGRDLPEARSEADELKSVFLQHLEDAERIRRVMEELEQSRQKAMLTERLAAVGGRRVGDGRGSRIAQSAHVGETAHPNSGEAAGPSGDQGEAASSGPAGDCADGECHLRIEGRRDGRLGGLLQSLRRAPRSGRRKKRTSREKGSLSSRLSRGD